MTALGSLIPSPFLASSGGGDFIIFIVIAVIAVISKIIEWYKNKSTSSGEENDSPTLNPGPSPRKSMEEIIRRALTEQEQKNQQHAPAPPSGLERQPERKLAVPPMPVSTGPTDYQKKSAKGTAQTEISQTMTQPTSTYTEVRREPSSPIPASKPAPEPVADPYAPLTPVADTISMPSMEDLAQKVKQLSENVETNAQKSINQAYSSAESSYMQAVNQLAKSTQKAKEQSQALIKSATPPTSARFDFHTPDLLKKAVIMSEILASPKGMK